MQARADSSSGMVLLAGNSHPDLAKMVSERLDVPLGDAKIDQLVRGKHVFILQSGSKNVNNDVMELLVLIYACKTSMSKTITVIMPYLPYSKQCRMLRRSSIAMKLVAEMICKAGASRLVFLDLYKKEIQGFFSCPVDNLRASSLFLQHIKMNIPDYNNAVIVAKSPDVVGMASSFADDLRLGVAVIHGEQKDEEESGLEDGRQSPPLPVTTHAVLPAQNTKQKPPLTVVGDVGGRIAIMVDDIIDDAQSFVAAADVLKARGAYKIYVIATHGVLSPDAPALLEASPITEVIVTNTIPHNLQKMRFHKIKTVDISLMICEAIRRIFNNESMGRLSIDEPKEPDCSPCKHMKKEMDDVKKRKDELEKEAVDLKKMIMELEAKLAAAQQPPTTSGPAAATTPSSSQASNQQSLSVAAQSAATAAPTVAPTTAPTARVRRCSPVDYRGADEPATKRGRDAEKKERCYKGRLNIQKKK